MAKFSVHFEPAKCCLYKKKVHKMILFLTRAHHQLNNSDVPGGVADMSIRIHARRSVARKLQNMVVNEAT